MGSQNYAYAKQMLDLLLSKAPLSKQDELRSLIDMCVMRGLANKSIDPQGRSRHVLRRDARPPLPSVTMSAASVVPSSLPPAGVSCGMGASRDRTPSRGPCPRLSANVGAY
ncbi:hypothetical protein HPP92_006266 [Vanilla planifolia]|uniref:Uncharacterized protein n=1 Tax=Vanilla planifolia TaxID=51239 RepID=A0A835RLR6_VANPL|nr:hypothetical protein HPP92_006266 [Vanilla planifolia]